MQTKNRLKEIKAKGFAMNLEEDSTPMPTGYQGAGTIDFNKMRVGVKTLDDAILKLGDLKKANNNFANKVEVLRAINDLDYDTMRDISNFFYRCSGLYSRMVRYLAFMYRYDWFVTPYVGDSSMKTDKLLENFSKVLRHLDKFHVKKTLGEIALKVIRNGVYYGYKVTGSDGRVVLQELHPKYCRSRYYWGDKPAVEFNMKYFDDVTRDTTKRMQILKMFPDEFKKGYRLYKEGKLPAEEIGDSQGWYLLDWKQTVKFNANNEDYPMLISVIPLIIDLDEAQDLDKKKMMQRLLKIIIQKMPLDKNGELIFDIEEARQMHNNAVQMLCRAIGVDVLTTFADVTVESMVDSKSENQTDDLQRVERQVYNEAGISQMQFNTDGNLALEKSIANDEATIYNMILQFEGFLNELVAPFNKSPKKLEYSVQILSTTIYNYKELAKIYREQTSMGYSKMLPQVAMGQSQSSILANAHFENEILELARILIPPLQSSTMNAQAMQTALDRNNSSKVKTSNEENSQAGRPEKPMDEKSEKTIKNLESMS